MDTDKAVEFVTREVMKRLQELSCSERKAYKGKILILDSLDNVCLTSFVSKLKNLNYEIEGIDGSSQKLDISEYEYLIVPVLENRELSNISLGVACGIISETVTMALLQGKRVLLLEEGIEYRKYIKTCSKAFYARLSSHEKNLTSYGIEILNEDKLLNTIGEEASFEMKPQPQNLTEDKTPLENFSAVDKKILTEMDMQRLFREGKTRISIKRKSIITPLAMDYIKTNNIEIIRTE